MFFLLIWFNFFIYSAHDIDMIKSQSLYCLRVDVVLDHCQKDCLDGLGYDEYSDHESVVRLLHNLMSIDDQQWIDQYCKQLILLWSISLLKDLVYFVRDIDLVMSASHGKSNTVFARANMLKKSELKRVALLDRLIDQMDRACARDCALLLLDFCCSSKKSFDHSVEGVIDLCLITAHKYFLFRAKYKKILSKYRYYLLWQYQPISFFSQTFFVSVGGLLSYYWVANLLPLISKPAPCSIASDPGLLTDVQNRPFANRQPSFQVPSANAFDWHMFKKLDDEVTQSWLPWKQLVIPFLYNGDVLLKKAGACIFEFMNALSILSDEKSRAFDHALLSIKSSILEMQKNFVLNLEKTALILDLSIFLLRSVIVASGILCGFYLKNVVKQSLITNNIHVLRDCFRNMIRELTLNKTSEALVYYRLLFLYHAKQLLTKQLFLELEGDVVALCETVTEQQSWLIEHIQNKYLKKE